MAILGAAGPKWRYTMCPLDTDASRFGPFAELITLWRGRIRPGRVVPQRDDLDFVDFAGWFGRIFIARIERDPFNLRFTLFGTELVEWWQVDYTNKTLGEMSDDPQLFKDDEIKYFERMDREPFIGIASGQLYRHSRGHINVIFVDLPHSDGEGLSHIISAGMRIDIAQTIEDVLPDCPLVDFRDG